MDAWEPRVKLQCVHVCVCLQSNGESTAMDDEQEIIRRVGQQIFGQLALELPPREFELLLSLWVKYRDDMEQAA